MALTPTPGCSIDERSGRSCYLPVTRLGSAGRSSSRIEERPNLSPPVHGPRGAFAGFRGGLQERDERSRHWLRARTAALQRFAPRSSAELELTKTALGRLERPWIRSRETSPIPSRRGSDAETPAPLKPDLATGQSRTDSCSGALSLPGGKAPRSPGLLSASRNARHHRCARAVSAALEPL